MRADDAAKAAEYLRLAQRADAHAKSTKDPEAAGALQRIADGYFAKAKELGEDASHLDQTGGRREK